MSHKQYGQVGKKIKTHCSSSC